MASKQERALARIKERDEGSKEAGEKIEEGVKRRRKRRAKAAQPKVGLSGLFAGKS